MKIKLSDNPRDYGLPDSYKFWRENQKEACEEAVNLEPGDVLLEELVTGGGKSGVPGLVSFFRPGTTVLLASTDLQSQYSSTIPFFRNIWGQGRKPNFCVHPENIATFRAIYGEVPFRSECKFRKSSDCEYFDHCPYEISKAECIAARARVLNHHYANFARWWRGILNGESDLFVDECHRLPVVLSGLVSVEMLDRTRSWLGLPPFEFAVGGAPAMLKKAARWASRCEAVLLPITKAKNIKLQRSARNWRNKLGDLASTLAVSDEAEWYIESRPGEKFFARPVIPGPYSARLLDSHARSFVLMSATIGGAEGAQVLAAELGIRDYKFVTYPHIFKKENRPVFLVEGAPAMSYKSDDEDYETQFRLIRQIMGRHPGQRGVVHCMSWKHAEMIKSAIQHNGREIMVPRGDRVTSIQEFMNSEPGTVVVSPSWHEGLDLADDAARFAIVAKVNYLSLADKVTWLRLKRRGGNRWYQWNAALGVVQSCGRIVRHEEDWGVSYILDKNWTKCARYSPEWFEWERLAL